MQPDPTTRYPQSLSFTQLLALNAFQSDNPFFMYYSLSPMALDSEEAM